MIYHLHLLAVLTWCTGIWMIERRRTSQHLSILVYEDLLVLWYHSEFSVITWCIWLLEHSRLLSYNIISSTWGLSCSNLVSRNQYCTSRLVWQFLNRRRLCENSCWLLLHVARDLLHARSWRKSHDLLRLLRSYIHVARILSNILLISWWEEKLFLLIILNWCDRLISEWCLLEKIFRWSESYFFRFLFILSRIVCLDQALFTSYLLTFQIVISNLLCCKHDWLLNYLDGLWFLGNICITYVWHLLSLKLSWCGSKELLLTVYHLNRSECIFYWWSWMHW